MEKKKGPRAAQSKQSLATLLVPTGNYRQKVENATGFAPDQTEFRNDDTAAKSVQCCIGYVVALTKQPWHTRFRFLLEGITLI